MTQSSRHRTRDQLAESGAGRLPPITLPQHPLTRRQRPQFAVAEGVRSWNLPRTVLGRVPVGAGHVAVPLAQAASIGVRNAVRPLRLLVGAALVAVPLLLSLEWATLPIVVVGAWVALVPFSAYVVVETDAGATYWAAVRFGHRIDAEFHAEAVDDLAARARVQGAAGAPTAPTAMGSP